MRKLICMLLVLLLSASLFTVTVDAAETDIIPLGICSVVTDSEGEVLIEDTGAVEELDCFQSYELYIDRLSVLSVEPQHRDLASTGVSAPSFYHAEFTIPDTTLQIYLTGLRSDNVEEIQNKIIDRFLSGISFDLADLSFIDTEKTLLPDGDENLCWAAASSNILYYTGWGAKAGFSDEDALFDLFASSFNDKGSHQENAMAWFFNGAALQNNIISLGGSARIKNYPLSGGYFRDYAYDMVSGYHYLRGSHDMNRLFEYLRQGYGISPGINLMNNETTVGAHAITLWGTVTDLSHNIEDPERYHGILISDSDSHMINSSDRRNADRVLSYYPLHLNKWNLFSFDYDEEITAVLDDYEYLMPYSKNVPRETDLASGRNKAKYSDLIISQAYLSTDSTTTIHTLFESGSDLRFAYAVSSAADTAWRSSITTKRSIVSSTGEVIYNDTDNIPISYFNGLNYIQSTELRYASAADIPAGDYTLTFTVNPNRNSMEAYYYNNTRSIEFHVRDSFIRGDYDNDRVVDLTDATLIQHRFAELSEDADSKTEERCDIEGNGFDIIDATWIQRYLNEVESPYSVGEKELYREV